MFKIESYVTPYISAYFNKYVKDFNPQDFQVSIWQGGATFTNVNLDLEAVESELNLPLCLSSGHIHELKINIPWTKLTSEPIVVHVKTIEVALKLKPPVNTTVSTPVRRSNAAKSKAAQEVPPTYIQSLMNKIMNNVKFVCENVILKYVEEDIVFSLNVKTVVLSCVNSEWEPAFVDIASPNFMIRKLLSCSDLTICLDRSNSSGKIETYQEPLLYKCSFDVRIMQQFHGYFAKSPYFTRYDFFLTEMKFSITDEQIPMVLRLYYLIMTLSSAQAIDNHFDTAQNLVASGEPSGEALDVEDYTTMWSWGSWAVDMVSQIPEVLLGPMDESTEPLPPCEFPIPVVHVGIFVESATITFKWIERTFERFSAGTPRVRYLPFVKCHLQGIICDHIRRGMDLNTRSGVSRLVIEGIGICPCGLRDCTREEHPNPEILNPYEYFSVGKLNPNFAKNTLFDPEQCALGDVKPPADYKFKYNGHLELYTEEHMLDRTPGVAFEILDISPSKAVSAEEMNPDAENEDEESELRESESETNKSLSRIVIAPCNMKICSPSIHRAKIIYFAARQYDYESYAGLNPLLSWDLNRIKEESLKLSQSETCFYKTQFTFFKPRFEIVSADHPDYDSQSHIRAHYRRRRTTTASPSSHHLLTWPKLVLTCDTIDGSYSQPNVKFRNLIQAWVSVPNRDKVPSEIARIFSLTYDVKICNLGVKLQSGSFQSIVFHPFNWEIKSSHHLDSNLLEPRDPVNVADVEFKFDDLTMEFSKPLLMMCQILVGSCVDEKMSEHLFCTTILQDLHEYKNGHVRLNVKDLSMNHARSREVGSYRILVGSAMMEVISPDAKESITLFKGPIQKSENPEENKLGMIIFQSPLDTSIFEPGVSGVPIAVDPAALPESIIPIFVLKITSFNFNSDLKVFKWVDYKLTSLKRVSSMEQMSSDSLFPSAPLTVQRKTDGFRIRSANSCDDVRSQTSVSTSSKSVGLNAIAGLYRTPHASTHARTMTTGSIQDVRSLSIDTGVGDSQSPQLRERQRRPSLEEEFLIFSPQTFVQTWEKWIVKHLNFVKNTYILIGIEGIEWTIPVREKVDIDYKERILGSFNIQCAMISAYPQGTPGTLTYGQFKLPVILPEEIKRRELYPLRIQFRGACGFTECNGIGKIPFLHPVEILLTLTMTDKIVEGKRPTIASCIHSDIPSVRVEFCFPQIKLLTRLIEQLMNSKAFFINTVPSLILPPLDTIESEENIVKPQPGEASTTGSVEEMSTSQTQSRPLDRFNSTSSLPDSSREEKLPETGVPENNQTTATFWAQMPLAQFQFILSNSCTGAKADATHQLVFDVEDILSHLDIHSEYIKWSFKVASMNLRLYKKYADETWGPGECLGVIMSCGNELTRGIQVLCSDGSPQRGNVSASRSRRSSSPIPGPSGATAGPPASAQHRVLSFTFTRVVANDYHWKSEVSSPMARWSLALQRYFEKNYAPYEDIKKRVLSEFDIKLKALDFVFCPSLLSPFIPTFNEFFNININKSQSSSDEESPFLSSPRLNNNTLPLIYLETEAIRIFLKTLEDKPNRMDAPDLTLLTISSINMHSQSENSMHRTLLKPDLYRLAEQARIIFIPGSPVEDRQYRLYLRGISVVTCSWKDIEANSRLAFANRSSGVLKTMGENPAFEWNTIEDPRWRPVDVVAYPLVDRLEIYMAYSPAIVFERVEGSRSNDIVIGGHSVELNITNDLLIHMNLQQLNSLSVVVNEFQHLYKFSSHIQAHKLYIPYSRDDVELPLEEVPSHPTVTILAPKPIPEVDSGVGSLHAIPGLPGIPISNKYSDESIDVQIQPIIPLDILMTLSHIQLSVYRLLFPEKINLAQEYIGREEEIPQNNTLEFGIIPVFLAAIEQPHVVVSIGKCTQKIEISIFDLFMASGSGECKWEPTFSLPEKESFTEILFESLEGERNPKTGMRTSFCTFTLRDFWLRPGIANCELFHPVRVVFNQKRLSFSKYKDFIELLTRMIPERVDSETELEKVVEGSEDFAFNSSPLRVILGFTDQARIAFNQIVLEVDERPLGLPRAAIALSVSSVDLRIQSRDKYLLDKGKPIKHIHCDLNWIGLMISTVLGEKMSRKDILMSPWSGTIMADLKWYTCLKVPSISLRLTTDPISFYVGPQNILALLQLYHTFGGYLFQILAEEERQFVEVLAAKCDGTNKSSGVTFSDNLKSGTFRSIHVNSPMELPEVYQLAFCNAEQTMTWKYPEPRVICHVQAFPFPLEIEVPDERDADAYLSCAIEYWDDTKKSFCRYTTFEVEELLETRSISIPDKSKFHEYVSKVWRLRIITPREEQMRNYGRLLRPEILIACAKIDSLYDPTLIPRIKFCLAIPRLSIHLLNQLRHAGRFPEKRLGLYDVVYGGLTLYEQPFAVLEFSHNVFCSQFWVKVATMNWDANFKMNVTDYSFLTEINAIDRFGFKSKLTLEEGIGEISTEIDMIAQPIVVKLGASALHTLVSSLVSWHQVLNSYTEKEVNYYNNHLQTHVNLTQVLICNDTATSLQLAQVDTNSTVTVFGRQCYAYTWSSQKAPPKLKLGLQVNKEAVAWSVPILVNQCGTFVRKTTGKTPLFIQISNHSTTQKRVTIFGPVSVANALDEAIEVGILYRSGGKEINWILEGRAHGPSQMIDIQTVEQIRFRFVDNEYGDNHGWSIGITPVQLRGSTNKTVTLSMYEERNGVLQTYNVWCSLVEETLNEAKRYLIVVSPFYRMRSSLSLPVKAKMETARPDHTVTVTDFVLEGRGAELQLNFLGSHEVVHHLTIRLSSSVHSSKPTIPLLPAGPALENVLEVSPIDTILDDIMELGPREADDKFNIWPYVGEGISADDWTYCHQPGTDVQVNFKPWIPGLPSVMIEARPWALFVNMLGDIILFTESDPAPTHPGPAQLGSTLFTIPNMCAFSPAKIQGKFKLGVEIHGEVIWTPSLSFTKTMSRTDIHHVNSNQRIPIDCVSRLEIHGKEETYYLTLEARLRNSILVLTIRPTYCIQNRTSNRFNIKGLALNSSKVVNENNLELKRGLTCLEPEPGDSSTMAKSSKSYGIPLMGFMCDWDTLTETDCNKAGIKYIGLQLNNGPFWFVQLIKFETIFDNMSSNKGIHAKRQSIVLPNCQPISSAGTMTCLENVTTAISVSWTCRDGQVWISIADEQRPECVIQNISNLPFLYCESNPINNGPFQELNPFPQFLYLPPYSQGHYTSPSTQAQFPLLGSIPSTPFIILGTPSLELAKSLDPRQTMLILEFESMPWSNKIKCAEHAEQSQSIQVGYDDDIRYVKVHVEQLGPTYYIFIEEMSNAEVSAKDIRGRISCPAAVVAPTKPMNMESDDLSLRTVFGPTELNTESKTELQEESEVDADLHAIRHPDRRSSSAVMISPRTSVPYFLYENYPLRRARIYCNEIRLILTDDLACLTQKREFISFTARDIFFELETEVDEATLRILEGFPQENTISSFRIGDIQIDNALYAERKHDFPVILLREQKYNPRLTHKNFSMDELDEIGHMISVGDPFLVDFTFLYALTSTERSEVLKVWLTLEPFTINMEDQFIYFIMPAIDALLKIGKEHLSKLSLDTTRSNIIKNQRMEGKRAMRRVPCALTGSDEGPTLDQSDSTQTLLSTRHATSKRTLITEPRVPTTDPDGAPSSSIHPLPLQRGRKIYSLLGSESPSDARSEFPSRALQEIIEEDFGRAGPQVPSAASLATAMIIPEDLPKSDLTGFPSLDNSRARRTSSSPPLLDWNPSEPYAYHTTSSNELMDKIVSTLVLSHNKRVGIPEDVESMMKAYGEPIYLRSILVNAVTVFVTMRMSTTIYLAVDHSPIHLAEFGAASIHTTSYELGQAFAQHYLSGAVYRSGNPIRILGSLELLGSPGTFVRSVSTGVKDFIYYPYEGFFKGPVGFVSGVSNGCGSLVKNLGAGTLTSVTNWAWSMSRNIDRLTLDREEQVQHEEGRRAQIEGVRDGLYHGVTGFAIRLLGAVGGITHHPMQSMIDSESSPQSIVAGIGKGIGKGIIGVLTKPIGGAVEFVAMTGQGLLRGAGWTPIFERRHELFVEDVSLKPNALVKYRWKLWTDSSLAAIKTFQDPPPTIEKVLLVVQIKELLDSSQTPINTNHTLILTTERVYVMDSICDVIVKQVSIMGLAVDSCEDKTLLRLKTVPVKSLDELSLAKERVIDFVRSSVAAKPGHPTKVPTLDIPEPSTSNANVRKISEIFGLESGSTHVGDFYMDQDSKNDFLTLLKLAQKEKTGQVFPVLR